MERLWVPVEILQRESSFLDIKCEEIKKQHRICDGFLSVLFAAKPKICCEKKFHDIRFNIKCMELNIFKTELKPEKKWLKIIKEFEDLLYEENLELSALHDKMTSLKNRRQLEKVEWMNIYSQFRKTIGLKHKHKGYFKAVFKKKIRPDHEKEPYKRHPSSESSESEENIDSDDDNHNVNKKDVDKDLLKEVMYFRLKRHEVEKKMKEYKRSLHADYTKETILQRRIQRVKDSLREAWDELSLIPVNRKLKLENMIWPAILYPENVHKEFFGKQTSFVDEQKLLVLNEMSAIFETITKNLKPINKLISVAILILTDRVVKAELHDLIDIATVFFSLVDAVAEEVDEYFQQLTACESDDILKKTGKLEEKRINIISEILLAAAPTSDLIMQSDVISDSMTEDMSSEIEDTITGEHIYKEDSDEMPQFEKVEISDILLDDKNYSLKSWRDVCDDSEIIPPKEKAIWDFDINDIILNSVPTLDCSLLIDDNYSPSEDYYMQELYLDVNVCDQTVEETGQNSAHYAKMLIELDVHEVVEDLINNISEKESLAKTKKSVSENFPTYPGGGLVLTREVLLSMENEDPDSFPYTNFYQEEVFIEELAEKPKVVHILPEYKETEFVYDMPLLPSEDFILLSTKDVLNSLNAYHQIKIVTAELEEQIRLLEKKVLKSKAKRINVEQELLAVMRDRTEAIKKRFSSVVNLELLQDVIENPHLHIKKYESELKIDSLKNDLKKLKAAEVIALKSLDKFGFENTIICHELLELRHEFKLLNKNYSSELQNLLATGKKPSAMEK